MKDEIWNAESIKITMVSGRSYLLSPTTGGLIVSQQTP